MNITEDQARRIGQALFAVNDVGYADVLISMLNDMGVGDPPKVAILWSSGAEPHWFFVADLTKRRMPVAFDAPSVPVYETRDAIIPAIGDDTRQFLRKVAPLARAVMMAQTQAEEIAACRALAKAYDEDFEAAMRKENRNG